MKTFAESNFPGRLIAVEGLDGSGKSTQIYLLKRWLEAEGIKVYFSEWNSSELVKSATSKGKKRELLTPTTFSLIHATDRAPTRAEPVPCRSSAACVAAPACSPEQAIRVVDRRVPAKDRPELCQRRHRQQRVVRFEAVLGDRAQGVDGICARLPDPEDDPPMSWRTYVARCLHRSARG